MNTLLIYNEYISLPKISKYQRRLKVDNSKKLLIHNEQYQQKRHSQIRQLHTFRTHDTTDYQSVYCLIVYKCCIVLFELYMSRLFLIVSEVIILFVRDAVRRATN